MKKGLCIIILMIIELTLFAQSPLKRVYQLYDEGKYEQGMSIVDSLMNIDHENRRTLQAKFYLLDAMGHPKAALEAALDAEKANKKKSPWDCIMITEAYLKLGMNEESLDWLANAVSCGFISYSSLSDSLFLPLRANIRFQELLQTIQDSIGIGKKAENISLNLLDGSTWNLSDQNGKVILVDFFATWCSPCREEMPNLRTIYSSHTNDPFEMIGISLDSDPEALKAFIKDQKLSWLFAFSGEAWNDPHVKVYGVNSIPSIWLVDKQGVLRFFDIRDKELAEAVNMLLLE